MKRSATKGITQLELLIALALMGLMAVLLANVLNFNRLSLERSQLLSSATERLMARELLRSHTAGMPLEFGSDAEQPPLEGERQSLKLQTLVVDGNFWAGDFVQIELFQMSGDNGNDLMFHSIGREVETEAMREMTNILAKDVKNLRIGYFGRIGSEAEARWHEKWSDPVFLPDLVKIEWNDRNGDVAPPLTLRPALVERHKYMSLSSLVPPG